MAKKKPDQTEQPTGEVAGLLTAATDNAPVRDENAAAAAIQAARTEEGDAGAGRGSAQEEVTAKPSGEPVAIVEANGETRRPRGRPRNDGAAPGSAAPSTRTTRAEALRELEERKRTEEQLRAEIRALQARNDVEAVNGLAGMLATAIHLASRFTAARRGPHWIYDKPEAQDLGDAWAPVIAPYAEYVRKYLPLGLALVATWNGLEKRLERDAQLAEEAAAKERRDGDAQ